MSQYPGVVARLNGVNKYRNTVLAGVQICPVQYNPVTKTVKVYTHLKIAVTFSGGQFRSGLKNQSKKILQRVVVNGK